MLWYTLARLGNVLNDMNRDVCNNFVYELIFPTSVYISFAPQTSMVNTIITLNFASLFCKLNAMTNCDAKI